MDISKYITTAVVLSSIFGGITETWKILTLGFFTITISIATGLILIHSNPLACGHRTASLAHHQRWHRNIDNGFNRHRATEFFKFSVSSENLKNTLRVSVPLCLNNKSTCPYVSVTCHMRFFSFFHSNPSKPSFFVSFSPSISRFNLRYTFAIPSLYLRFLL